MTTSDSKVSEPFLSVHGIGKQFGGTVALSDVDWDVAVGEVHCLVGENGSGKSTLIKIVAGVHSPARGGTIIVDGVVYHSLTPHRARELGIQVIFQDLSLFPNLSVMENIAISEEVGGPSRLVDRRAMRRLAEEALASLDADLPLDVPVGQLSVAQRQIVAICRGTATKARLLFMDEPTSSLTHHEVELLLEVVRKLKNLGVAIVFVSHRLEEVVRIAARVTVLRDGKRVATLPAAEVDDNRLAELMTGSRIVHDIKARALEGRKPVLEARGLSRAGEFKDISFTIHEGEVLGIAGLLGAGRTELALSLFGMSRLDQGEVVMNGKTLRLRSNQDAISAGIAYVSEDRLSLGLNLRQSIADNATLAVLDELRDRFGFVAPSRRKLLARQWIDRLEIRSGKLTDAAQTLSGGNQQRLVLAKWLATNPRVLILDSPSVGVDIRNKQGIYQIVRELAESGVSVLMISDEIPEVFYNCDRVLHMHEGRIVGSYVPGDINEQNLAEAVFA